MPIHYNSVHKIAVYSIFACLQKYRQRKISDQISPPIYRGHRYSIYRPIYSPCRYIGRPLLQFYTRILGPKIRRFTIKSEALAALNDEHTLKCIVKPMQVIVRGLSYTCLAE